MANKIDKFTYQVEWSNEDDAFIARCLEFPSLSAFGEAHEDALSELKGVIAFGIKKLEEEGKPVPEPLGGRDYSGEFRLRTGKNLHRELVLQAAGEGVSLNTLVVSRLRTQNLPSGNRVERVIHRRDGRIASKTRVDAADVVRSVNRKTASRSKGKAKKATTRGRGSSKASNAH